jgi:hypothetical protein
LDGARHGLGSAVSRRWRIAGGDGCAAHDIGFDHDVARTAYHQEMFDVVAADDDELATAVDGRGIDQGEARLTPTRCSIDPR